MFLKNSCVLKYTSERKKIVLLFGSILADGKKNVYFSEVYFQSACQVGKEASIRIRLLVHSTPQCLI